jgi:hypothetical protein
MFPLSDSSSSVIDVLQKAANDTGVRVLCGVKVNDIKINKSPVELDQGSSLSERFQLSCNGKLPCDLAIDVKPLGEHSQLQSGIIPCDRVIFATGSSRLVPNRIRWSPHLFSDCG